MFKLDKKDAQIIFTLDTNARQSVQDIARITHLSRDVVNYRIKLLEQKDIIQKYITIIDFTKFGYQIIRLYLKFQKISPEIEQQITTFFVKQPTSFTVYKTTGYCDLAIGFLVKDFHEYQQIVQDCLTQFRPFIAEQRFSIFLDYLHYPRNYLVEKKLHNYTSLSVGSFKPYAYDQEDLILLNLLKENARLPLLELAQKLHLTPAGVKYKLKNLEKQKVIVAYRLLLDTSELGYKYYKIDLVLEDLTIIPSLKQYLIQHWPILYRDITIGSSDFEFDCELRNEDELNNLITKLHQQFPQKIRSLFYYRTLKIYKYSYFPQSLLQHKTSPP